MERCSGFCRPERLKCCDIVYYWHCVMLNGLLRPCFTICWRYYSLMISTVGNCGYLKNVLYSGAQTPGARSSRWLNFVLWHLIHVFVCHQCGTCFMLSFWHLEFWGCCYIPIRSVHPWFYTFIAQFLLLRCVKDECFLNFHLLMVSSLCMCHIFQ
jgi:hypothetical protein